MKNTMISNKELEALQEIFKGVDHFCETHNKETFDSLVTTTRRATQVEKVHILLYMVLVKDFIKDIGALRSLLEEDESKFIEVVTDGGKITLDEVEGNLMTNMLMDILMK
jgi:hypothetical protein